MQDQSLFVIDMSPTLSYKVNSDWSVGVALNIPAFKELRTQSLFGPGYLPGAVPGSTITLQSSRNFPLPVPPYGFDPAFNEVSYSLGTQFKATEALTLGLTYREREPTTFTGQVSTNLVGPTLSDRFSVDLYGPRHLQGGAAYAINPKLTVSVDLQWTNWSDAKGWGTPAQVKFLDGTILGLKGLEVNYDAHDTLSLHTGVEYKVMPELSLMAGYVFDPSPFDANHVDILTYSTNRHILSLGASWDTAGGSGSPGWTISGSLQGVFYESQTINPGQSQNLGGVSSAAFASPGIVTFVPNTGKFTMGGSLWSIGMTVTRHF
jgi:long-chain fatty acid transport protein